MTPPRASFLVVHLAGLVTFGCGPTKNRPL